MGYFESDALEMLEVYLLETRQLNGQLAEILLEAEREGRFSESSIHSIFRVMHTIKSSSAMMGINGLSSLAHKLEDCFPTTGKIWTSWSIQNRNYLTFCLLPLILLPRSWNRWTGRIMSPGIRLCLNR